MRAIVALSVVPSFAHFAVRIDFEVASVAFMALPLVLHRFEHVFGRDDFLLVSQMFVDHVSDVAISIKVDPGQLFTE